MESSDRSTARSALVFWGVGLLVLATAITLHVAAMVLLLTFTGLLFGTTLRGTAQWLARRSGLGVGGSLVLCVVLVLALFALAMRWIVPHVADQLPLLWQKLEQAVTALQQRAQETEFGARLFAHSIDITDWLERHAVVAANVTIGVFGVLGAVLYLLFVTVYFAASPDIYRRGLLALVPTAHRPRAAEVLHAVDWTLQRWLWARLVSMTLLGIASTIGLWLLGVPLALTLGLLAGAFLFVPYLGSIAAAIPALLIALTISPMHVVYVGALYIAIHLVDGYVLDPLLQRRAISIPPLLLLGAALVAGELWGIVGVMIATPLVAATRVAIEMLYVEDTLHSSPPPEADRDDEPAVASPGAVL